jgi:uncharacterized delta-60 repeat protein
MRRSPVTLALTALAALLVVAGASAKKPSLGPPGSLDPGFTDSAGRVLTPIGNAADLGSAVALQKDGRIVVAGATWNGAAYDVGVARYLPGGALDQGFGAGGKATTGLGNGVGVFAVAVQPDGKILVAGDASQGGHLQFAVLRYLSNGAPDPGFNGTGHVVFPIAGFSDVAYAIALQPDGKIVLAGTAAAGGVFQFAVARLTSGGTLDPSFNGTGKALSVVGTGGAFALGVAVQKDGGIVAAGFGSNGADLDFALARFTKAGVLDTSFGGLGVVLTPVGAGDDEAEAVAIQKDGKLVAGGWATVGGKKRFAAARYLPSGALDASFGSGGKVTTSIANSDDEAAAVAVQKDGKIVLAGKSLIGSNNAFGLLRYTKTGALDTGFGTGGTLVTTFGPGTAVAGGLAIQPDGKIVAAGYATGAGNLDFAVARYTKAGTPDVFTSRPGIVAGWNGFGDNDLYAMLVQPDGRPVVAGTYGNPNADFYVIRLNRDATPDMSFGYFGQASASFGNGNDIAYAVARQPDGKLVLVGDAFVNGATRIAVARFTTNGALDPAFGSGGKVTTLVGSTGSVGLGVAVQPDGRIVVAGYELVGADSRFLLVRYNPDGTLDTTFDTDGVVVTKIGTGLDAANAIALQKDGKIVACGKASNGNDYDFALARYLPDGALDTGFGSVGTVQLMTLPNYADVCNAVAVQKDGRIVAAGSTDSNTGWYFTLMRLLPDGTLDQSFDGSVIDTFASSAHPGGAYGVAVDKKGRIVAAGTGDLGGPSALMVTRYTKLGKPDAGFGTNGVVRTAFPGAAATYGRGLAVDKLGSIWVDGIMDDGVHDEFAMARYVG